MSIAPTATTRRELLDWNLLYLFSYDVELDVDRQEKLGRFHDGFRLNLFLKRGMSYAYNVGREKTIAADGRIAVTGKIDWGADEILLREDDVASCKVRLTLSTDDSAVIHVSYRLQGYVGAGGVDRIERAKGDDRYGTESEPYEFPLTSSPRFHTTDRRYLWLNELQAIGFARAQIVRSRFRRLTQDVYALQ